MEDKKQKIFEEFFTKFVRKCLSEDILPVAILDYKPWGLFPTINFREVGLEEKKEILSSLDKEK